MIRFDPRLFAVITLALGAALAAGCGADAQSTHGPTDGPFEIDNGFESDDPSGRSGASRASSDAQGGASSGGASNAAPAPGDASGKDAQRAVEEADILKVDGNRLFALSRYGGLAVVDITNPDQLRLLGRKRTAGVPFEMYVRNGRAYVMMNDFGRWNRDASSPYGRWTETSEILAYDVSDPAAIAEVTHYDVPGSIADSRIVGDALYLVTFENGYCYRCGPRPGTIVTSFSVGGASIAKVDQLAYTASTSAYSSWQRSVSATNQRLYIAGPEWSWQAGTPQASSVIQVVDVTDPGGKLVKGADVTVAGQITSRWQMDEYGGVLRVVSQYGSGWGGGTVNPKVQTFTVTSAQQITPLGQTDIVLPKPESLRSVRFDGVRAYAITAERKDPLFTLDLSNPALPKQVGEVSMPGWIFYMEPRGDRLVGFGFDDTTPSHANMAVSLFDVSNLATPVRLKSVSFGSGWAQFAEDQDRVQKSVRVLDEQGLILVPFASYGRWDGTSCGAPQSGIQLIDFSTNDLTLRGLAPQHGMPRRAFIANGRMLAISDRNVTTFDITSRDEPKKTAELDLSNPAYRMVELPAHVASITNDWWTGEVMLSVTPKANADDADVSGKVSLASLATMTQSFCASGRTGWAAWYAARLFSNGNFVYVTLPVYTYDQSKRGGKLVVAAIDATNPAAPVLAGTSELLLTERDTTGGYYGYWGDAFWDGYGFYSWMNGMNGSLVGSGQGVVQLGSKLAYLELDNEPYQVAGKSGDTYYDYHVHRKLHVVDLANPAAHAVSAPIDLGDSLGLSPLHVMDGMVLTSRWLPSWRHEGTVRFFVDRVDLNGPSPVRLSSMNTPGSLLLADQASHRIVTTDYLAARAAAPDWQSCQKLLGWRGWFRGDDNECVRVDRSFKLADVDGAKVTFRQSFTPPTQNFAGVQIAEDRVYITRYRRYDYSQPYTGPNYVPQVIEDGGLWVLGGVREGQLGIVSEMVGDAQWPLAAFQTKVALYTEGGLAVYDTSTPSPRLLSEQALRGWGYSSHVLLSGDRAIASLGEWGLQTIRY